MCISTYGSDNIIYMDEPDLKRMYRRGSGWARRGRKIYGRVKGGKNPRTNLIMGIRRKSRQGLAPILFHGSYETLTVLWWMKEHLLKTLTKPSVIVIHLHPVPPHAVDNAPFHPLAKIRALLQQHGHERLPLPKYSPDLKPIENTFGAMKTNWMNATHNTPIDDIVTSNC